MAEDLNTWFADVLNGLGTGEYTLRNTKDGSVIDMTVDRNEDICPIILTFGYAVVAGHTFEGSDRGVIYLKACDDLFNVTVCTILNKYVWTIEKVTA